MGIMIKLRDLLSCVSFGFKSEHASRVMKIRRTFVSALLPSFRSDFRIRASRERIKRAITRFPFN